MLDAWDLYGRADSGTPNAQRERQEHDNSSTETTTPVWMTSKTETTDSSMRGIQQAAVASGTLSKIFSYLDNSSFLQARKVCKSWRDVSSRVRTLRFPAVFFLPVEVIQQILALTTPSGFNNARKTCKAWYFSSLDVSLLREKLSKMGFTRKDPLVRDSHNVIYLSRRLSRECSLGSDGSGECRLRLAANLDFCDMAGSSNVQFTVSICGKHVMLLDGCVVYVYRLQPTCSTLIEFVASVLCPRRILAVSMDTSNKRYSIAVLMVGYDCIIQASSDSSRRDGWAWFMILSTKGPKVYTIISVPKKMYHGV